MILKLMIAAVMAVTLTACQTDDSYKIGGDIYGTPKKHQSGSEVDPFDSAHSPG